MKHDQSNPNNVPHHAPGRGSDKEHPETPADANERFREEEKKEEEKQP